MNKNDVAGEILWILFLILISPIYLLILLVKDTK